MLTNVEWLRFEQAIGHLFAPGLVASNLLDRSFEALNILVPSDFAAFGSLDTTRKQMDLVLREQHANAETALRAFGRLMTKYPLFNWDPAVNEGRPFQRSDFFSRRQFRDLDIYTETFRPLGLEDHFALPVPSKKGTVDFFGLQRGGRCAFTEADRALLTFMQGHLRNARILAGIGCQQQADFEVAVDLFQQARLTRRESEVFYWLIEGKTLDEISVILNIKRTTTKTYVESIYERVGARTRIGAVRAGLEILEDRSLAQAARERRVTRVWFGNWAR